MERGAAASVREAMEGLRPQRVLAYTTVMTVLDNLHRKHWLRRHRDGRAWRYAPALTRQAYTAQLMHEALAVSDDRAGVLARFVEEIDPADAAALAAALREVAEAPEERRRVGVVTIGGALVVYAFVVGLGGPAWIRRAAWPLRAPRLGAARRWWPPRGRCRSRWCWRASRCSCPRAGSPSTSGT